MEYDDVSSADAIIILILCVPFYFAFEYFDQPFRGFVAALSAGVVMSLFRLLRSLSFNPLFWLALFGIAICHAALVYFLPYKGEFRFGFMFFPLVVVDIYLSAKLIIFVCGIRHSSN